MGKILFVDDDPNLLSGIRRQFRRTYNIETAEGGEAALQKIRDTGNYDVIVSDMRMPGMDGITFLSQASKSSPESVRIMLTGNNDLQTAIDAVNKGQVFAFLNKPCEQEALSKTLDKALEHYRLLHLEKELLEKTLAGSVKVLLDVMRVTNPLAFGRCSALRDSAVQIAENLGAHNIWEIKIATLLSAIGWMSVPEHVLEKVAHGLPLNQDERALVKKHPDVAYDLLRNIPRLEEVAKIIRHQDQNFDGTNGPEGAQLNGEDIPLGSRILKVLNDLTPMYRPRKPTSDEVAKLNDTWEKYDPAVLAVAEQTLSPGNDNGTDLIDNRVVVEISPTRFLPGDILEQDLATVQGSLLLSAGNELSEFHIAKLRNHPKFKELPELVLVSRQF